MTAFFSFQLIIQNLKNLFNCQIRVLLIFKFHCYFCHQSFSQQQNNFITLNLILQIDFLASSFLQFVVFYYDDDDDGGDDCGDDDNSGDDDDDGGNDDDVNGDDDDDGDDNGDGDDDGDDDDDYDNY